METNNDYIKIILKKDSMIIEENYASLGVEAKSVYTNTDEYSYSVVKNQRDGTVVLVRTDKDGKEIILDAFDYQLTKIVNRIVTVRL